LLLLYFPFFLFIWMKLSTLSMILICSLT
jgi:hypothetical protein